MTVFECVPVHGQCQFVVAFVVIVRVQLFGAVSDFMSIYELVERVAKYFDLPMTSVSRIKSETLNQAAKRPPVTGFDLTKSRNVLGYLPHSFEQGMSVLMQQVKD